MSFSYLKLESIACFKAVENSITSSFEVLKSVGIVYELGDEPVFGFHKTVVNPLIFYYVKGIYHLIASVC